MKLLVELLLCILHPVAVVLMWINLAVRTDLGTLAKLAWAIFGLIPFVPFLYVLTGGELF
jgi:NADH:ubiquinone oxidoreductase subunit 3 (subunit A)